ncbi:MAG: rane protein [Burkholderiaceae bacterium]|nr:rane protein [Burkholderiaceae bacterium]
MTHFITPQTILDFWFTEIDSKLWWTKDAAFDALIRERFAQVHAQANRGELVDWRDTSKGRLAEIIVLDQFSRNMFRDTPRAFASDALALVLAQEAIRAGCHFDVPENMRGFMFLPFMHSESAPMHERALALYTELGEPNQLDFEYKHKRIIDRFGRYPHRNAILGRVSTEAELAFLQEADSSF